MDPSEFYIYCWTAREFYICCCTARPRELFHVVANMYSTYTTSSVMAAFRNGGVPWWRESFHGNEIREASIDVLGF